MHLLMRVQDLIIPFSIIQLIRKELNYKGKELTFQLISKM